jgi:hypothetical protein
VAWIYVERNVDTFRQLGWYLCIRAVSRARKHNIQYARTRQFKQNHSVYFSRLCCVCLLHEGGDFEHVRLFSLLLVYFLRLCCVCLLHEGGDFEHARLFSLLLEQLLDETWEEIAVAWIYVERNVDTFRQLGWYLCIRAVSRARKHNIQYARTRQFKQNHSSGGRKFMPIYVVECLCVWSTPRRAYTL